MIKPAFEIRNQYQFKIVIFPIKTSFNRIGKIMNAQCYSYSLYQNIQNVNSPQTHTQTFNL